MRARSPLKMQGAVKNATQNKNGSEMAGLIGEMIGGCIGFYALTLFFGWGINKIYPMPYHQKLSISAIFTIIFATIAGGYGFANGGEPVFMRAFFQYASAGFVVLVLLLGKDADRPNDGPDLSGDVQ